MKANTKDFKAVVMEKKEMLDIIEDLLETLGRREEDVSKTWGKVGTKQKTKWSDDQGESLPVWLDENDEETFENTGKPKIVDDYDYYEKAELDDRDRARLAAINKVRETLAALA